MEQTQKVFYLETHSQNPYYNLAFEEFVLTHRLEGEYLLLWQNDNTIVVGQNQNTEAEINRAFVEEHHINVASCIMARCCLTPTPAPWQVR